MRKTFSVIIATFNSEKYIRSALDSLFSQNVCDYETILIDGGSTDKTVEIIKSEYSNSQIQLISERDEGIGDAWNKGISASTGKYVALLNSDDKWPPGYLKDILSNNTETQLENCVIYGRTQFIDHQDRPIILVDKTFAPILLPIGFRFLHTSCVVSLKTYRKIGPFDISRKIAVDTDWLLRAHKAGVKFIKSNHTNIMRIGGVSHTHKNQAYDEYLECMSKHGLLSFPRFLLRALHKMRAGGTT